MMKKLWQKMILCAMVAAMAFSMAACNNTPAPGNDDQKPGVSEPADGDKPGKTDEPMSEEDYKAKITELATSISTASTEGDATTAEGATKLVETLSPLYTELANLNAPEAYKAAQEKIKTGAEASVELLKLSAELIEMGQNGATDAEAASKLQDMQTQMAGFQEAVVALSEGLTEVGITG